MRARFGIGAALLGLVLSAPASIPLRADPGAAVRRPDFEDALRRHTGPLRPLYAAWVDRLGANGILDAIEALHPQCHSEAHDLGKVLYERLGSVGEALRACDRRCHSGCMHGVLMEAFTATCSVDGQLRFELLAPAIELTCRAEPMRSQYRAGDCAHGVGHALMFLSGYEVGRAVGACDGFREERMRYFCATGAYMEFVTAGHADASLTRAAFSPCDVHPYPAACARYLMPRLLHVELAEHGTAARVLALCERQAGARRIGCIHGVGNAFMPWIARAGVGLDEVCARYEGAAAQACIEGVMERMGRYHPERARQVCAGMDPPARALCDEAVRHGMYGEDKDVSLYLAR